MQRGRLGRLLALAGLAVLAWSATAPSSRAQGCATCGQGQSCEGGYCQRFHCPPPFHHCAEHPPCIRWHCGCPRPVCNPCSLPNFGYFQTCWTPWPLPPDWSHCKVPPPAAYVQLQGPQAPIPGMPNRVPGRQLINSPISPAPLPNGGPVELTPEDRSEGLPRPAPFIPPGTNGNGGQ